MTKIIPFLALLTGVQVSIGQDLSAYQKKLFVRGGNTLRYRILFPGDYQAGKDYPLIVFLHGGLERGLFSSRT